METIIAIVIIILGSENILWIFPFSLSHFWCFFFASRNIYTYITIYRTQLHCINPIGVLFRWVMTTTRVNTQPDKRGKWIKIKNGWQWCVLFFSVMFVHMYCLCHITIYREIWCLACIWRYLLYLFLLVTRLFIVHFDLL